MGILSKKGRFLGHRWVFVFLGIALLGSIGLAGCDSGKTTGELAPDFTLDDLEGKSVTLSDFRGQPVFINFWATSCPPCREEMPDMEKVYQEYKDTGLVIIGVDLGESVSTVQEFVEDNGYSWIFVIDKDGKATQDYRVTTIPKSVFVDKDGRIRYEHVGPMSQSAMKSNIEKIME